MKSQNCILINFVTDARTHGPTHGRAEAICLFNFSKVGGIINCSVVVIINLFFYVFHIALGKAFY